MKYSLQVYVDLLCGYGTFFLFWLHMWHMEAPGPGIESEPEL